MNETNSPNVIVTGQPGLKKAFKITLAVFCLAILAFGLILLYKKTALFDFAKNKPPLKTSQKQTEQNTINTPMVTGGGGGKITQPAASESSNPTIIITLTGKVIDYSSENISFETVNHELITIPKKSIKSIKPLSTTTQISLKITKDRSSGQFLQVEY